ncbi:hypothetical protein [Arsenophonus endosymbiont of Bemisia tabaci]|nr:hypothetical protein [Arsenophonus endosymbiont of Bemisia tabaci]CAA2930414.1 hypothetical protein ARSQ2_01544 [Arsenophonus endosymbiont of Bemisia tabaci Q2]
MEMHYLQQLKTLEFYQQQLKRELHDVIAKRLNFDYKIYVFLQYKFNDIE